jgi:hypothetical protein
MECISDNSGFITFTSWFGGVCIEGVCQESLRFRFILQLPIFVFFVNTLGTFSRLPTIVLSPASNVSRLTGQYQKLNKRARTREAKSGCLGSLRRLFCLLSCPPACLPIPTRSVPVAAMLGILQQAKL